ncbi:MAG: heparinase II/III family protein [Kiritimatiellales bacterium]
MKQLRFNKFCIIVALFGAGQIFAKQMIFNPMTEEYLNTHLNHTRPRLVLTPEVKQRLKEKIITDPAIKNVYTLLKMHAKTVQTQPLQERVKLGHRMLGISRRELYRINVLGIVYCIEKDPKILARLNDEVVSVCNFSDWNPEHFLDVGEMALAVSLALDWTAGDLPWETIDLAMDALIEKAINPSFLDNKDTWWMNVSHNWSQVCHGGLIAAALTIAEREPQLAAKTIRRALDSLQNPLADYAPDGIYPEGPSYWEYGTIYTVITISMLENAFGTDFGLSDSPGFMESALFRLMTESSNGYYNYSDCADVCNNDEITLAWFAARTGDAVYYQKNRFLRPLGKIGYPGRFMGLCLIWLAQYEQTTASELPTAWCARGLKPVAVFTGGNNDPRHYYFAAVGGKAELNHGNMDGGSFIFELDGVRWGIDCGNQSYYNIEKTGFDLWSATQNSQRWTLLTKNNFGHSTITINNQSYRVDGKTELIDFRDGDKPIVIFDMTASFGDLTKRALRTFTKDSSISLTVQDQIIPAEKTELVTWQFITIADTEIMSEGAKLRIDEKELELQNLSHPSIPFTIISLDPPPLALDKQIKNLKRIELQIPASAGEEINIYIRLSGSQSVACK